MVSLPKGGNAPLATRSVRAVLSWTESEVSHDIDLCGLLLAADGHVRTDEDFVFYNQPSHPSNAVRHEGRSGPTDRVLIEIAQLPEDVERVVLAASISDGTFGSVRDLAIAVTDAGSGTEELRFEGMGATSETAFVVGEVYQRDGTWKFRAIGQGWDSGLAGLATNYGVNVGGGSEGAPELGEHVPTHAAETIPEPTFQEVASPPTPELLEAPVPVEPVRDVPPTRDAPPISVAPAPQEPASTPLPRRRMTAVVAPRGSDSLDTPGLTLPLGQAVVLTKHGSPAVQHFWLRAMITNAETPLRVDLCALAYDSFGTVRDTVFYRQPGVANGSIGLVNQPVGATFEATSAIEFELSILDRDITGILVAALSYEGESLSGLGSIVTELVDETGAALVRTECPATPSSSALLVSLLRGDDGVWFMTSLGIPASGRSALSLVGAGFWALGA